MSSKHQGKSIQKMVYNKDSNLNSTGDASIIGLFKSTSSLSRSLRQQSSNLKYKNDDQNYTKNLNDNRKNSLSTSGKMIMDSHNFSNTLNKNPNIGNIINHDNIPNSSSNNLNFSIFQDDNLRKNINQIQSNPPKSMKNNIEIRNLTHFYDKIQSHQETYELLFLLKSDKRMRHLDRLDEFDVLKLNFLNSSDDKIKRKFDVLQSKLKLSKSEIDNQFSKSDEDLIKLFLRDIDYIQIIHKNTINSRQDDINNTIITVDQFNDDSILTVDNYINQLKKDLIDIGFMLDSEIEEICDGKKKEKNEYFEKKKFERENIFNSTKSEEIIFSEESEINLQNFILRWKNVKLNRHVKDLVDVLNSKDFIDSKERYELLKDLKKDQEKIYNERCNLIMNKMLKFGMDDVNVKNIEGINKELDDIYNNAQNLFDMHTQKLMNNSEFIFQNTLKEVEKFKEKVKKISYNFGKDNKEIELEKIIEDNNSEKRDIISEGTVSENNVGSSQNLKKTNVNSDPIRPYKLINYDFLKEEYKQLNSIEELIDMEINPLIEHFKTERKNYITKIISYLDDYDEYINNNCVKLVNTMLNIANKNDLHKKNFSENEKKYLLEMAKAADHNDDVIFEKEDILKKLLREMKESFHKEDLDIKLESSFNVINELEVEYRDYFSIMENLLDSHEKKISEEFYFFEILILEIFGIKSKDKIEEIQNRRNLESEFLTLRKEQENAQNELKDQEELKKLGGKTSAPQKKKPTPAANNKKKGEPSVGLIPIRPIENFKSFMGNEYLIDFTIPELVKNILRNIIYNREDDILGLNPKKNNSPILVNSMEGQTINRDLLSPRDKIPSVIASENNTHNTNFLEAFNPYEASTLKEFFSPISENGEKLLSEENKFEENFLIKIYTEIFNKLIDRMKDDLKNQIENAKSTDNEKREELLTELDIRLKSLAPRKGKIEVEEYDKRLNEIEKHKEKYSQHITLINQRNKQDNDDCNNLIAGISKEFDELNLLFEKLSKVMDDEASLKSLDDKYKKFKSSYYDLNINQQEAEIKMVTYTKYNPENLINLNKNFLVSLQSFEKGGTYSEGEIIYYDEQINILNEEKIKKDTMERESFNLNKLSQIKSNLTIACEKMEKKYQTVNENIQAKESVGKKFGSPKRLANDIIINIKMKCNQAKDGLDNLFSILNNFVIYYNENKTKEEYIMKDLLPLEIRKIILSINNCIFNYGKYISAFKQELNYNLIRVNLNELSESTELQQKEEFEEDEKRKIEELENLGYLSKFLNITPSQDNKNSKDKDKEIIISFIAELNGIDEKVKQDCAKIYLGEYLKLINNPEKIPVSLNNFLINLKFEMESFRHKCVRDLRTYNELEDKFKKIENTSEKNKQEIYSQLGPYLANPYYLDYLIKIEINEESRSIKFIEEINKNQIEILENEEIIAELFYKRIINNFEALTIILDNYIFEEEYISLDDEEYFKARKDYNTLLKLKPENKGNLNLDSKRTFKKIYSGLNKNMLKVNYFEKYQDYMINNPNVANDEDKVKTLKNEYIKDNTSKNITALKLQTNKNLFYYRNKFYNEYSEIFAKNLNLIFEKFDKLRQNEIDYKNRFNEILKSVKNIK